MYNPNHSSDATAPTDEQPSDDGQIHWLTLDDQLILYDIDNAERWIQSDTTIDLQL